MIQLQSQFSAAFDQLIPPQGLLSCLPAEVICQILDRSTLPLWCSLACTCRSLCALVNDHAALYCTRFGFAGQGLGLKILKDLLALCFIHHDFLFNIPVNVLMSKPLHRCPNNLLPFIALQLQVNPTAHQKPIKLTCSLKEIFMAVANDDGWSRDMANNREVLKVVIDRNDTGVLHFLFQKVPETEQHHFRQNVLRCGAFEKFLVTKYLILHTGLTADDVLSTRELIWDNPILPKFSEHGVDILRCLLDGLAQKGMPLSIEAIRMDNNAILGNAVRRGDLDMVEYLFRVIGLTLQDAHAVGAIQQAIKRGHVQLVEYLFGKTQLRILTPSMTIQDARDCHALHIAGRFNQESIFYFLVERLGMTIDDIRADDNRVVRAVAKMRLINLLRYLFKRLGLTAEDARAKNNKMLKESTRYGHLDVAKFLIEEVGLTIEDVRSGDNLIIRRASQHHQNVILYFIDAVGLNATDLRVHKNLIIQDLAYQKNPTLLMDVLFGKLGMTADDARADDNYLFSRAATWCRLDIIKYLFEKLGFTAKDVRVRDHNALNNAVHNAHYDVVVYLISQVKGMTVADVNAVREDNIRHCVACSFCHGPNTKDYLHRIKYDHLGKPRNPRLTCKRVLALTKLNKAFDKTN